MQYYELVRGQYELEGMVENEQDGEWATRADAEQMEKERNAYRDECISRGGRELQALCEKEQAAKDAVEMAKRIQKDIRETFEHDDMVGWEELPDWKDAQAIIERYAGGKGNG